MSRQYEDIRYIAASKYGETIAISNRSGQIRVLRNGGLFDLFEATFDLGGKRMAISNSGDWLAVGSYENKQVSCFSLTNFSMLWQLPGLKMCNEVKFLELTNEIVFVNCYQDNSYLVSISDGELVKRIRCINCWTCTDKKSMIVEQRDRVLLLDSQFSEFGALPKTTFAILDGCFVDSSNFIASYSSGPLELIDLTAEKKKWSLSAEGHFLAVGFIQELGIVLAICWDYRVGGPKTLFQIDVRSGKVLRTFGLGNFIDAVFLNNYHKIVTTTGRVYSTIDGSLINSEIFGRIEFHP